MHLKAKEALQSDENKSPPIIYPSCVTSAFLGEIFSVFGVVSAWGAAPVDAGVAFLGDMTSEDFGVSFFGEMSMALGVSFFLVPSSSSFFFIRASLELVFSGEPVVLVDRPGPLWLPGAFPLGCDWELEAGGQRGRKDTFNTADHTLTILLLLTAEKP